VDEKASRLTHFLIKIFMSTFLIEETKKIKVSNKSKDVFQWFFILILSLQFLLSGYAMLLGEVGAYFIDNGYAVGFMYFIGFLEVVCSIGLFFKPYRSLSCFILVFIMSGAMYTHLTNEEIILFLVDITNIGALAIIIWVESEKRYLKEELSQSTQS
jgi:uncharacterized membrane protein YphA (DoxX/SURF4 family)